MAALQCYQHVASFGCYLYGVDVAELLADDTFVAVFLKGAYACFQAAKAGRQRVLVAFAQLFAVLQHHLPHVGSPCIEACHHCLALHFHAQQLAQYTGVGGVFGYQVFVERCVLAILEVFIFFKESACAFVVLNCLAHLPFTQHFFGVAVLLHKSFPILFRHGIKAVQCASTLATATAYAEDVLAE